MARFVVIVLVLVAIALLANKYLLHGGDPRPPERAPAAEKGTEGKGAAEMPADATIEAKAETEVAADNKEENAEAKAKDNGRLRGARESRDLARRKIGREGN